MSKCKCGHDGGMHSDGDYTHTGECVVQVNKFDGKIEEMFCECDNFTQDKENAQ